jgi:hypothetical protein
MMFLSSHKDHQHELDFRFEVFPETNEFFFVHHGLNISELAERIDVSKLGSVFYLTEANFGFQMEDVIADRSIFVKRYGVEPVLAYDCFLRFDLPSIVRFFANAQSDYELDFTIVGTHAKELAEDSLWRLTATLGVAQRFPSLSELCDGCWFHIHDNHFFSLLAQSMDLLPAFVEESILGFFHQVHAYAYKRPPRALIDLIITKYHTTSLVCFPTASDEDRALPENVHVDEDEVRVVIETAESCWTAYNVDLPKDVLGHKLRLAYKFKDEHWTWQEAM